ncbi:RND family efflux transporter MFP subunit [Yoonia maricola]|uniref:RND family efflux transporter MFP subunit n=1 Tax=Yoonia maricola TaxID=420999 RepID=A0A2M8W4Y1_9RHOB|nr:efflux RND transporter periplasmic adaptor subunit [Yoonia maricola]PJI85987.1 RND family efflux transporter MFP subunit [Yoonia maricola]
MKNNEKPRLRRFGRVLFSGVMLVGLAAAALASINRIQDNAAAVQASIFVDERAIPVLTTTAEQATGYDVPRQYAGRTVIAEQAELSFEVGGRVILADVSIGDRVATGDILGAVDSARLSSNRQELEARLLRAETARNQALDDLRRSEALLETGSVTRTSVEQNQTALELAEQDISAIEAQIDRLQFDLRDTELRAPFDGILTQVEFDVGDVVSAGIPVLQLVDANSIEAHVGVPVAAATQIEEGQIVPLTWRGNTYEAVVSSIVPVVNAQSQTMLLVLDWEASRQPLEGEMLRITLSQSVDQDGFWVPLDALVSDLRGLFAVQIVVDAENGALEVTRAPVQVHYSDGAQAYVSGALQNEDRIVTRGTNRVAPGQAVILASARAGQ